MSHCSDDDLLLEYYGEASFPHLATCAACASRYRDLRTFLEGLTLEPPERGDRYGLEVWQQIRHRLPAREPKWPGVFDLRWGLAAAAAVVLLVTGFAAGRLWSPSAQLEVSGVSAPAASLVSGDEEGRRRVVLLTVADHLDRSQRVLADVMNAPGPGQLSVEQQWASDLVVASRLYRQDVVDIDEPAVAAVLEELERVLLDIVHQPSQATAADLDEIRRRIDSAALLFKVRVMTNELQRRLDAPSSPAPGVSTSTIG